jgi:hypothetical protein
MKRSLLSPPDAGTRMPLVALLPSRGDISKLEGLTSSLFARYERAQRALSEQKSGSLLYKRTQAEFFMLKEVLEWLSVDTQAAQHRGDSHE